MAQEKRVSLMLKTNARNAALPIADNVYMALRNHDLWVGALRHNALTESDEYHPSEQINPLGLKDLAPVDITDDEVFHARRWLERVIDWSRPPGKDLVHDAISAVARQNLYHPVRDYLAPLASQWDGTERIAHWLTDFCNVPATDYSRTVAAKTLIGAVRRVFNPGCKLDTMLVLVGRQGARKSTLIRILGRGWVSDTPLDIGSKDAYENIRGAWLVELAELAGMGGRDVEKLKAFFSSPADHYRPPYARRPVVRPRTCAFIGSTNGTDFLKDATGSRRFWCVSVGDIDTEALEAVVDQLWAEATLRAFEGAPHWLTDDQSEEAEAEAERYVAVDGWEEVISERLEGIQRVHWRTIYGWLGLEKKDIHAGVTQRITRIMCGRLSYQGWYKAPKSFRIGGEVGKGFRRDVSGGSV